MRRVFSRIRQCLLLAALCVSCCAIGGCLESHFELAGESRLPKWFTIPPGLERADVTVTMDYYTVLWGNDARFTFKGINGKEFAKVSGEMTNLCPYMPDPSQRSRFVYPQYVAITANGITDIMEHKKMEPIFYVSDDPDVWKILPSIKQKIRWKHPLC